MDNRERLKAVYGDLFDRVSSLFFRHDPLDIAYVGNSDVEPNPDEYEPEVHTVLPRLSTCQNPQEVACVLHEEFNRWFGGSAGHREVYEPIAGELWEIWQEFQGRRQVPNNQFKSKQPRKSA